MRRYTLIHRLQEVRKVAEVQTSREITVGEERGLWEKVCSHYPGWDGLKEGYKKQTPRYLFSNQKPSGPGNYIWDRGEHQPPETPLLDLSQSYPPLPKDSSQSPENHLFNTLP